MWMIVIFAFSNELAVVSDKKSKFIIYLAQNLGLNLNSVFGNLANFIVRKISHFMEYFILCVLLFNREKAFIISIAILILYASLDEIHQIFISGRLARIGDVFVDAAGGIIGLLVSNFFNNMHIIKKEL